MLQISMVLSGTHLNFHIISHFLASVGSSFSFFGFILHHLAFWVFGSSLFDHPPPVTHISLPPPQVDTITKEEEIPSSARRSKSKSLFIVDSQLHPSQAEHRTIANMRTSILLSALFASAFAAPAYPELNLNAALPGAVDDLSEYFTMLVRKIQQGKSMSSAPSCDLSKAVQPIAS